jgi:hypothetical protein
LRLVDTTCEVVPLWRWFCSRCGTAWPDPSTTAQPSRVCEDCGLGLMLQTRADAAPGPGEPFIVVDSSLAVQAVSGGAEAALAVREPHAVNRHITELLIPADAEARAPGFCLAAAITAAAAGDAAPSTVWVRPTKTFGVRLRARIAACGPPRAALLVLE